MVQTQVGLPVLPAAQPNDGAGPSGGSGRLSLHVPTGRRRTARHARARAFPSGHDTLGRLPSGNHLVRPGAAGGGNDEIHVQADARVRVGRDDSVLVVSPENRQLSWSAGFRRRRPLSRLRFVRPPRFGHGGSGLDFGHGGGDLLQRSPVDLLRDDGSIHWPDL